MSTDPTGTSEPGALPDTDDDDLQPEAAPANPRRARLKLLLRIVGILVAIAAVALCVRAVVSSWDKVSHDLSTANVWLLVLAFLCGMAGTTGLALNWGATIDLLDGRRWPRTKVVTWFFAGELGKYIPGSVWALIGRGELAHRAGVRRRTSYTATLMAMCLMLIGAVLLCALVVPFELIGGSIGIEALALLIIPAVVVFCLPPVNGFVFHLLEKVSRGRVQIPRIGFARMARLVLGYLPAWALTAAVSVLVAAALGYQQQIGQVAVAALLAWVVGFVAIPVPAGAGIREVVFYTLCGLGEGPGVVVAIAARLALILSDGLGGVVALGALGLLRRKGRDAVIHPENTATRGADAAGVTPSV
ncbi:hypothetical protein GIS00_02695 [Nakamurella sp. YIM 132087]|uniref:Uncharacterized protein n=1 Tax=Nakamurella alba TaxID=2665158 RepID=A0A7K1FHU5_9ACTN|nr:lysylphosphatidylglycerol synthase transmembrane domain-containing protein [Nakamurella alba]MTD12853.1 hypothetical protein [Nakamurella alba]